jgi:TldD protein
MEALNAAKLAGASWADVRVQRQRRQNLGTREQQVTNVLDTDTIGCGVRVLVDGTWGFAATRALTKDGVARAARQAVALAKRQSRGPRSRGDASPPHPRTPTPRGSRATPSTPGAFPSRRRWPCCCAPTPPHSACPTSAS